MIGSEIAKKSVTIHVVIDTLDWNFEIFQLVAIEIFQIDFVKSLELLQPIEIFQSRLKFYNRVQ